jgi:hypothetical protein
LPAADALAQALLSPIDERAYRVALTFDEQEIVTSCIDANDPAALREAIEFFELADSDLPRLLDEPFAAKPTGTGEKPYWPSRFSNGDYPVFYAARERETAGQEYSHYAPRRFGAAMGQVEIRLHLISCRVNADVKDLRALASDFPELVADTHEFCQEVGAVAKVEGLDGLLALSVRRAGATNIPVFERVRISEPEQVAEVIVQIDAVTQVATFNFV